MSIVHVLGLRDCLTISEEESIKIAFVMTRNEKAKVRAHSCPQALCAAVVVLHHSGRLDAYYHSFKPYQTKAISVNIIYSLKQFIAL